MEELLLAFIFYITLFVSVCIPLIPSILIYRLFPDTKVGLSGPLQGLTINASGAFAAYVITLIVVFPLINKMYDTVGGFSKPYWTITAPILLFDMDGKPIHKPPQEIPIEVMFVPRIHNVTTDLVTVKIPGFNLNENTTLTVQIEDFGSENINLSEIANDAKIDNYKKTLRLDKPIMIQQNKSTGEAYVSTEYIN